MRWLAVLLLAGLALGEQQYFTPQTCSCSRSQEDQGCFSGFGQPGRYSYYYETYVQQYIPGYEGKAEFRLGSYVDFSFYKDSCFAELYVYNVTAYDSSYRYNGYRYSDYRYSNSSQYNFFDYSRQQALGFGERELFYKYNESLPRYRFYFCFNNGFFGDVYPHRDEPTWSVNFKRGIISTFQAKFCPSKGQYYYSETTVEGKYCPYEYRFSAYDSSNFSVYKDLQYEKCHYRPSYFSSSFYGSYFQGGEKPLTVSGQTYYRYFDRRIQHVKYTERYQFQLKGYTFQGQDYGYVYSYVYQDFYYRNFYYTSYYDSFPGLPYQGYYYGTEGPRSIGYEFTDHYSYNHYYYNNFQSIYSLVRNITYYRQQTFQGEFLDKFHELQQRLRYVSFEEYKRLYTFFSTDAQCRSYETDFYSCRRTFFESFVTTGTDAAARFFRYLVYNESSFFGKDDQLFSMYSFLYGQRISEQYLRSVYDTCQFYRNDDYFWGKCAFVLSSLTSKYCSQYECPYVDYTTFDFTNSQQTFDSYYAFIYKYFYGEFYRGRETYTYRSFVAFRALGNFVRGQTYYSYNIHQSFYRFFYSVAFNQGYTYPSEYRLAAFEYYAYCARYFYADIYTQLYKYFYDESQPTEYRIAAFNGIMYSFKYGYYQYSSYWQEIFRTLQTTKDTQFYCYAYSYLYRLYESDYFPDRYWTGSISYYFRHYGYYYTGRLYSCRNYGYFASQVQQYTYSPTYFFQGAPYNFFGGRFYSTVQYKRTQDYYQFPQKFNYRFDGFFYNQEYQPFEFGFQSEDFQKMFEYFYSPDGYFFRTGSEPTRDLNQFKFSFFFRMFEYELFYEEFSGSYIEQQFERQLDAYQTYQGFYRLFKEGFTYQTFTDLLYRLKRFNGYSDAFRFLTDRTWYDQVYNFDRTFRTFDYQYTLPTRMGFPLSYNLTSYFHFRTYLNGSIGCDETCQYSYGFIPDRVTARAVFKPQFATRFFGSVSFYSQYFAPSLQFEFTGYGGFEQYFNGTFRDGQFTFDYSVPHSYQQLGSFSSRAYTYYYRYQKPYRYFEYQGVPAYDQYYCEDYFQPQAYYYRSDRCENCSWYYDLYDYTGANFTYYLTYPNATYYYQAPSFPFSGYFNFTFGLTPRRYYRGQYLTENQTSYIYYRQPYSRFMFTFNRYGDYYYYNGTFYPPTYYYEPYTTPTYRFYLTRYPYYDQYNFRYYNFTFYGQRYTNVTGYYYPYYPSGYYEGFSGYFTYRDFEGSFYDWFAHSYFNSTGFFRYYSACSEFNTTFYGNSSYYYFFSSYYRYFRQKYYSFYNYAQYNNRLTYSNFTFNFEGDEYYGFYNSSRRYFMNDMYFDFTRFFPYGRYSYQPFNFYSVFPSFYQQSCYMFDKSYVTFDGFRYNYNHGCKHYVIYNDDFKVSRVPSGDYFALQVAFGQRYGGYRYHFDREYFHYGGQKYYLSQYEEGKDYDFGEFTIRRFYTRRCNSYRIFFKRFHFHTYYNGYYANFFLSPMYYGKTYGICGNMNGYAGDDTYTRQKTYTTNVRSFFSSWGHNHHQCSSSRSQYVSPVDTQHSSYQKAYETCYYTYNRLFSHCYGRVEPKFFLERCIATYMGCSSHTDECLAPVLCAYSAACYNYGYYPHNSCFYSQWSQQEYSLDYWRSYRPTSYYRYFTQQQFSEFTRQAQFTQTYSPTYYPYYPYYYYPSNCTSTRNSQWYYGRGFDGGYGFQFCQREDNQYARFRYTYSNFFYDQCEYGERCCSSPATTPSPAYRYYQFFGERCRSFEQIPTCPTGYYGYQFYDQRVRFNCPNGQYYYHTVSYHSRCRYGTF